MDLRALDYVPVPIVVLERAAAERFEYVWMNHACARFSGLALSDVRGKTPAEVFPGRAGEQLMQRQLDAARTSQPANYAYALNIGDRELWIETDLVPVCAPDGTTIRLVATMQDRTEERRLVVEQTERTATLKTLEGEIEQYISMAAHDLRTPMNHVNEIAAMLREDFVDHGDGKLELIEILEEVGAKADNLIMEVLSYARASSVKESCREISLQELSSDIFAILDPTQRHRLASTNALLETDSVVLQIALRNLVDNSLKHSSGDTAMVEVGFDGERNGLLHFSVRDHGLGLDDPSIAFLDTGEVRFESGFGLLGIKRMIVGRNGTIHAEQPPEGHGTLIRFALPGRVLTEVPTGSTELDRIGHAQQSAAG